MIADNVRRILGISGNSWEYQEAAGNVRKTAGNALGMLACRQECKSILRNIQIMVAMKY